MSNEGMKVIIKSINNQITRLLNNPGPYCLKTINELLRMRKYYETKLQESK